MERKTTSSFSFAKINKRVITLLLCLFVSYSWAQPVCNAHFGHYALTNNPDSVHFYPPANPAGSHYLWTFGDGTSSNLNDPWHFYHSPGTYYVCLVVEDSDLTGTCRDSWCDSIVVGNPPPPHNCSAHFIHYGLTNNPDSVHFYPDSSSKNSAGTIYYWTFGDGTTSLLFNPWHLYAPGNYLACLTVRDSTSNGICYSTYCDSVHVKHILPPPPVCNAHFTHYSLSNNPDSVHFIGPTNPANSFYLWTFGDGTSSNLKDPWHFYNGPGTYYVCLVVEDSDSTGTCRDSWCDSIVVGNPPPPHNCSAHFIHYGLTNNPDSVHFYPDSSSKNSAGTIYYWTFGDGTTSLLFNPWHLYAPGNYLACLTVRDSTANGICYSTYCDSVHVKHNPPPPPVCNAHFTHYSLTNNPDSVHFIGPTNPTGSHYQWTFGDGTSSNLKDPWHFYNSPGTYYVCLVVEDSDSTGTCRDSWCDSIVVGNPPPPHNCSAHFIHYGLTNNPDSVHFYPDSSSKNSAGTIYYWTFGDGTTSLLFNPWHLYAPGNYLACLTVRDSTSNGICYSTYCDSVHVKHNLPPPPVCNAHFTDYSLTNNPDSVHFIGPTNPANSFYLWTFGDGTSSNLKDPWHFYNSPGTYYVCLVVEDSDSTGTCRDSWCDSIVVGNPPPPHNCSAHFIHYALTNNPDSVHFYPDSSSKNSAGTIYYWTFGDGTTSNLNDPWHLYAPGNYLACLTVRDSTSNGICYSSYCDSVHVKHNLPPPPVCNAHFGHYALTNNPDSVHFYPPANPAGSHCQWTFGDGTSSSLKDPWHFFASDGIYYVCLVVEDADSTGTCRDSWCDSIVVGNPPPPVCNAHFTYTVSPHNPDSIQFIPPANPSGTRYLWTFGDSTYSTHHDPWHFFTSSGMYYVCLTVWDSTLAGNCTDTWCDSIYASVIRPPYYVSIYPNPMRQYATVSLANMQSAVTFNIFGPLGNLVYKKENLTDGDFEIGTASLGSGIYFYEINAGSERIANGKLIITH